MYWADYIEIRQVGLKEDFHVSKRVLFAFVADLNCVCWGSKYMRKSGHTTSINNYSLPHTLPHTLSFYSFAHMADFGAWELTGACMGGRGRLLHYVLSHGSVDSYYETPSHSPPGEVWKNSCSVRKPRRENSGRFHGWQCKWNLGLHMPATQKIIGTLLRLLLSMLQLRHEVLAGLGIESWPRVATTQS